MGLVYARQEDRGRALEYFQKAREADPEDPWVLFRIAEIHRYQKSFDLAEAEYRSAIEKMPSLSEARLQLGLLLLESARHQEAESVLRDLLELEPDNAEGRHRLAIASEKLGRADEARRQFERALELAPEDLEIHLHYGNLLMRQGERELGEAALLRFQELKRGDDRARALSARLELEPGNVDVQKELVRELLALGRRADALREVERLLAADPASPDLQLLWNELRERQGARR
jgi:Tfp pilus assembly protein PilF